MNSLDELNPIPEREDAIRQRQTMNRLRVAMPGIVEAYDTTQQTVTVRLAIRENWNEDRNEVWTEIPLLPDVPIVFPRAGGYVLTFPITKGDEVLVVFGDMCIDGWWQNGGVQNQIDCRRHDLSDAFAIPGPWSQPRRVSGYSTNSVQLRNEAGNAYFEIINDTINIVAPTVNLTAGSFNVAARTIINGKTTITKATDIQGRDFVSHTHSGVQTGGGNTGGVN